MSEKVSIVGVPDEFLMGILKANELTTKNYELEKENKRLKSEKIQLQTIYNELMDKNIKLQKIIDALMEG